MRSKILSQTHIFDTFKRRWNPSATHPTVCHVINTALNAKPFPYEKTWRYIYIAPPWRQTPMGLLARAVVPQNKLKKLKPRKLHRSRCWWNRQQKPNKRQTWWWVGWKLFKYEPKYSPGVWRTEGGCAARYWLAPEESFGCGWERVWYHDIGTQCWRWSSVFINKAFCIAYCGIGSSQPILFNVIYFG